MRSSKNKFSTRAILASFLIASSFISAYLLSVAANRSEPYWVARQNLLPGMTISALHLEVRAVTLKESHVAYLPASDGVLGLVVARRVTAGELIPRSALSPNRNLFDRVSVPIAVQSADLPQGLLAGEMIDLYQVGDPRLVSSPLPPSLILSKIYILGIDRRSENLGSGASLTISVKETDVLTLLRATAAGRLVVVRVNG
jgi:hypothetical protein